MTAAPLPARPRSDWNIALHMLRYASLNGVFACIALALTGALLRQLMPVVLRGVIDGQLKAAIGATTPADRFDVITRQMALFGALAVAAFCTNYAFAFAVQWVGQGALMSVRGKIFDKLLALPLSYHDRNSVGGLVSRVMSETGSIGNFVSSGLSGVVDSLLRITLIAVFMLLLEWQLAVAAIAALGFLWFAMSFFARRQRGFQREIRQTQAAMNGVFNEKVSGVATVQLHNREQAALRSFDKVNGAYRRASLSALANWSVFTPTNEIVGSTIRVTLLMLIGWRAVSGQVTVGTAFAFFVYLQQLLGSVNALAGQSDALQAALASGERTFDLLDEPPAPAPDRPEEFVRFRGALEFDDVWFSYAARGGPDDWALRGVKFKVAAGESIALVGATGSGKTSIALLMARLYEATRGRILLDGTDISRYAPGELRRHIGVVLQDAFFHDGTIEANLRVLDSTLPEDVRKACAMVGIDGRIEALPAGYQTPMRGAAAFSAGEKQLLALARALTLSPSTLLVLDEATANVDAATEQRIQDALKLVLEGRTSIIIAHRLSTIRRCHRILVMEKGRLVEEGSHDELLALNGHYAALHAYHYGARATVGAT